MPILQYITTASVVNVDDQKYRDLRLRGGARGRGEGTTGGSSASGDCGPRSAGVVVLVAE